MFLKELGLIAKILPFRPRYGGLSFPHDNVQRNDIYIEKRKNDKINSTSYIIFPDELVDGKVNKKHKYILSYKNNKLNSMLKKISKAVRSSKERKYIYSYWDGFDVLCHKDGCAGAKTENHFRELDSKIDLFIGSLRGTDSTIIITADHGLIDAEKSKTVFLNDYPEIYKTLTLPLCGEPRVAYCYVHPENAGEFERFIKIKLGHACEVYKSGDLIARGAFGLYGHHEMLKDRVGDYILIMKENYIIKDKLLKEDKHPLIGNHGGLSEEEMFVPLIWVKDI